MENCLYQKKAICTFDLKDENGLYYEDRVLDLKQAAADRQLSCIECGAHVYLAAGPIKEPYFAHYDLADCDYGNGHETEELKKGKRLLYQLLKRSFSDSFAQARFRMENGMYSTLYCALEDGRQIAMDYRLQNNSLEKFRLRDNFYQENKIKPIYVMGIKQEKDTKQIDWYQSLLQSSMGYLAFLDTDKEQLLLKKSFGYRLGNERRFKYFDKAYPIKELVLDREGTMICDFTKECSKIDSQIKDEKLSYQKRQEKLKELREENLRLQEIELYRQEAYRRTKEQEEKELQELYLRTKEQEVKEHQEVFFRTKEQEEKSLQEVYCNKMQGEKKLLDINYIAKEMGLNPVLLEKCHKMIEEGNAHLVSKKYYDAIMGNQ